MLEIQTRSGNFDQISPVHGWQLGFDSGNSRQDFKVDGGARRGFRFELNHVQMLPVDAFLLRYFLAQFGKLSLHCGAPGLLIIQPPLCRSRASLCESHPVHTL